MPYCVSTIQLFNSHSHNICNCIIQGNNQPVEENCVVFRSNLGIYSRDSSVVLQSFQTTMSLFISYQNQQLQINDVNTEWSAITQI